MAHEQNGAQTGADLVKDIRMATTVGDDGKLWSRPMVVQQVRFDGDVWFVTERGSGKATQIEHGGDVNAALATGNTWVSLAGTADVTRDAAKARDLWNGNLDAWFPVGPRTPGLVLISAHAESAQHGDLDINGPVSPASSVVSLAAAKVKGKRPDIGENGTVALGSGPPTPAR